MKNTSSVLSNEQRARLVYQEEKLKSEAAKRMAERGSDMSKRILTERKN